MPHKVIKYAKLKVLTNAKTSGGKEMWLWKCCSLINHFVLVTYILRPTPLDSSGPSSTGCKFFGLQNKNPTPISLFHWFYKDLLLFPPRRAITCSGEHSKWQKWVIFLYHCPCSGGGLENFLSLWTPHVDTTQPEQGFSV